MRLPVLPQKVDKQMYIPAVSLRQLIDVSKSPIGWHARFKDGTLFLRVKGLETLYDLNVNLDTSLKYVYLTYVPPVNVIDSLGLYLELVRLKCNIHETMQMLEAEKFIAATESMKKVGNFFDKRRLKFDH